MLRNNFVFKVDGRILTNGQCIKNISTHGGSLAVVRTGREKRPLQLNVVNLKTKEDVESFSNQLLDGLFALVEELTIYCSSCSILRLGLQALCQAHLGFLTHIIITPLNDCDEKDLYCLFEYRSLSSLISITFGIAVPLVSYIDYNEVKSLKIDELQFDVKCESGEVKYLDRLYNSVSYDFKCKNNNRLENLPVGPFKFTYNNNTYTFTNDSSKLTKLKDNIIEVFCLYANDM